VAAKAFERKEVRVEIHKAGDNVKKLPETLRRFRNLNWRQRKRRRLRPDDEVVAPP
jgi:hypothetical protein